MTGGMAFIYDKSNDFEKKVNPDSVVWQNVETELLDKIFKRINFRTFKETGFVDIKKYY